MLHKTDERIARIYAERSGMPQQHFTELMNRNHGNGQWLTPEEAKNLRIDRYDFHRGLGDKPD